MKTRPICEELAHSLMLGKWTLTLPLCILGHLKHVGS